MDEMIKAKLPVSIVVITYNSESYIIDTLESCARQSYSRIELIISDDSSNDRTVDLCNEWLEINARRFAASRVISSKVNLGIPANCNCGVRAANGKWVKLIAGDDVLKHDAIENFVEFCHANPSAQIISSISQRFHTRVSPENFLTKDDYSSAPLFHPCTSAEQQHEFLLRCNLVSAPAVFFSKQVLDELDGFDERYQFMEDYPFWLKATAAGTKIYYLNAVTVFYRMHESSAYASIAENKLFNDFYIKLRSFEKHNVYPELGRLEVFFRELEYFRKKLINSLGLNRNTKIGVFVFKLTRLACPNYIYLKFKVRSINKNILQQAEKYTDGQ